MNHFGNPIIKLRGIGERPSTILHSHWNQFDFGFQFQFQSLNNFFLESFPNESKESLLQLVTSKFNRAIHNYYIWNKKIQFTLLLKGEEVLKVLWTCTCQVIISCQRAFFWWFQYIKVGTGRGARGARRSKLGQIVRVISRYRTIKRKPDSQSA